LFINAQTHDEYCGKLSEEISRHLE